jgi:uncharacterized protein (DUF1330 family)
MEHCHLRGAIDRGEFRRKSGGLGELKEMSVFWIGRTKIVDPSPLGEYRRLANLAREKHPHTTLAQGGKFQILEGETYFDRFVIHQFSSFDAALSYYNSPEYQQAVLLRQKASADRGDLVLVESM